MFTKVCGLTTKEQIDNAVEFGYDAVGIVTYRKSKRYCPPDTAVELAGYAKGRIKTFVVGISYSDVRNAAPIFDYVQIYEIKQVPNLVLATKEAPPPDLRVDYVVYDASMGSGVFNEFPPWINDSRHKIIVAGGLTEDNVCHVINQVQPFGVDVSSGVEKEGTKDIGMMKAFIDAVRSCT